MDDSACSGTRILIVRIQARVCALQLVNVIETMRPLPIEPIAGAPRFVRGVSIVRGMLTPVVDLGTVLGVADGVAGRFVTLRMDGRQIALSVDTVLGVRDLDAATIDMLPPLLQEASKEFIETIGTLDARILVVLRTAWELPDEVWQTLAPREVSR